jgi:diacylglycerol kinase (ATP)
MNMKTAIIINPNAGSVAEVSALHTRLEQLPGTAVLRTDGAGHAQELAREAARSGAGLVVAAGGDGTLNEVLNGLSEGFGRVRLGLLPLGTGNDFARSINVPADLDGALEILLAGRTRRIDVGCARLRTFSRYFINMAVGGFSGIVSEKADEAKERWGPLAYLRAAIGTLGELQGFRAVVTLNGTPDGTERIDLETYNVVVSNGRFVAAGIPVAPQSETDDGYLDLMLVPSTSIPQLAFLASQVLLARHLESDLALYRKARSIEIESDPPMSFNVDGEVIGDEPARFEVLPQALEVVVGTEGTE